MSKKNIFGQKIDASIAGIEIEDESAKLGIKRQDSKKDIRPNQLQLSNMNRTIHAISYIVFGILLVGGVLVLPYCTSLETSLGCWVWIIAGIAGLVTEFIISNQYYINDNKNKEKRFSVAYSLRLGILIFSILSLAIVAYLLTGHFNEIDLSGHSSIFPIPSLGQIAAFFTIFIDFGIAIVAIVLLLVDCLDFRKHNHKMSSKTNAIVLSINLVVTLAIAFYIIAHIVVVENCHACIGAYAEDIACVNGCRRITLWDKIVAGDMFESKQDNKTVIYRLVSNLKDEDPRKRNDIVFTQKGDSITLETTDRAYCRRHNDCGPNNKVTVEVNFSESGTQIVEQMLATIKDNGYMPTEEETPTIYEYSYEFLDNEFYSVINAIIFRDETMIGKNYWFFEYKDEIWYIYSSGSAYYAEAESKDGVKKVDIAKLNDEDYSTITRMLLDNTYYYFDSVIYYGPVEELKNDVMQRILYELFLNKTDNLQE